MHTIKFRITNIDCEACIKLSNSVLKDLDGVTNIEIDPKNGEGKVESKKEITFQEIKNALAGVDKTAEMLP